MPLSWGRIGATGSTLFALVVAGLVSSCAFTEFEVSPYTPREVRAIYSTQEDLTFVFFRLDQTADVGAVRFELVERNGAVRPLVLRDMPFPAEPFPCGARDLCLQAQFPGTLDLADGSLGVIVATHPRFGPHPSTGLIRETVDEPTFSIAPIAVDDNLVLDPVVSDPLSFPPTFLRRDVAARVRGGACGADVDRDAPFAPVAGRLALEPGWWASRPLCLEVSPVRADAPGVVVDWEMVPSAVTRLAPVQRYRPGRRPHRVHWALFYDLATADATRCETLRDGLREAFVTALTDAETPIDAVELGAYAAANDGRCDAASPTDYPVVDMQLEAEAGIGASDAQDNSVLWVLMSNRRVVGDELAAAVQALLFERSIGDGPPLVLAVASSLDIGVFPGDGLPVFLDTLPYRPLEDPTLAEDLLSYAEAALPPVTLDHTAETPIPLDRPALDPAEELRLARVCFASPGLLDVTADGVSVEPNLFAWPASNGVALFTDFGEQRGVPRNRYRSPELQVEVEVCVAFCDGPLRTPNGTVLDDWSAAAGCARLP